MTTQTAQQKVQWTKLPKKPNPFCQGTPPKRRRMVSPTKTLSSLFRNPFSNHRS